MTLLFRPFETIPDVVLVEPEIFRDARGFFMETFKRSEFSAAGLPTDFLQDAHSRNVDRGIVRGLHYQRAPAAQGKLVRCVAGECFDVAVDIRRGSPTFGRHVAATLSAENGRMLWIPPGFAHGYQTLTDVCEILYKFTSSEYSAAHAGVVRWDDPEIGIDWPTKAAFLAPKDAAAPLLKAAEL